MTNSLVNHVIGTHTAGATKSADTSPQSIVRNDLQSTAGIFVAARYGLAFIFAICVSHVFGQFGTTITTTAGQPVNPIISQYVASNSVMVRMTPVAGGSGEARVIARIERTSAPTFTIAANADMAANILPWVMLSPGVPYTLTTAEKLASFANFNESMLDFINVDPASLREGNLLKLPPGNYRICYTTAGGVPANPALGCASFTISSPTPANAVIINTQLLPPANPDLLQYIIRGNVRPVVMYNNPQGQRVSVKIYGKLESVSPKPFSIALKADYTAQPSIDLLPSMPVQMTSQQVMDAFGNFNETDLDLSGITMAELRDERNVFKLPEGRYRMCFYARYDLGGEMGGLASNANLGCVNFNICYKAAAPQLTQPVSGFNVRETVGTVRPASPVIFAWTPPNAACGANLSRITYDFELREMFEGQTPSDALNNPPVYLKTGLNTTSFVFDTLLNKQVLQRGKKYVTRVRANAGLNSEIVIDNLGFSRPQAFIYGEAEVHTQPPVPSIPKENMLPVKSGDCSCAFNLASIDKTNNTSSLAAGGSFEIASLTVRISSLQASGTMATGEGTVIISGVPVMVSFKDIMVNGSGTAFAGTVTGKTASGFDYLRNVPSPSVSTDHFDSFLEQIRNYNLDAATNNAGIPLPFGLSQAAPADHVNVGIVSLHITPTQASYNAIAAVQLADANNVLSLLAKDVCFSNSTLICGDASFVLASDFALPNIQMNIKGYQSPSDPGTFVKYADKKMQQFRIHAEYIFPTTLLRKTDGSELKASLKADAVSWSDWVATVTMDPFQVSSLKDITFSLKEHAIYDHSTKSNAPGMPASFDATLSQKNADISSPLWTGFYLPSLTVSLPALVTDVKKKNKNLEVSAQHFIIDRQGVTGMVNARNVISLSNGSLAGWYCSIDDINIKFLNSSFKEGGLYGQVILPFSNKDSKQSQIDYSCTLSSAAVGGGFTYQFVARPKNDIDFSAWWARFKISNGSIMVSNASGEVIASANLSGSLNIEGKVDGYQIGLELIKIEELQIQTKGPDFVKVKNATMGFSSPQHALSGFPISIKNAKPSLRGANAGLIFDVSLNLSDAADGLLPDATTTFRIGADIISGARSVWKRSKLQLAEVKVKGTVAGLVHVDGSMKFFKEDPTFGDGIQARLDHIYFTGLEQVKISANAKFGKKEFSYWYFDASATIPPVPIAPGLSINGFGGGAYYNLEKDPGIGKMLPKDYFKNMSAYRLDAFKPKKGVAGFNAKIAFCSSEGGTLFAGFGEIGMSFLKGINTMDGQLFFQALNPDVGVGKMVPVNEQAVIRGSINFHLGIPDKVVEIKGAVDINAANVLKGGGRFALLSDVGNDNYYLKIGVPDDRIFVDFVSLATLNAYFMAGNKLDIVLPDPDPAIVDVRKLSGYKKESIPMQGGLAFGASLKVQEQLKFFPFKIDAHAGLGFDINLGRATAKCAGSKSSALPGINGWYATGQVYAGIGGRFSLFVDIFFYTGEVEIARLDASVLLTGGLPNPWWFDGYAMLEYAVLDNLISGNVNFKISMGDKCEQETKIFSQPLIAELTPRNGNKDVPLNAYLETSFNYPVEEDFHLTVTNKSGGSQIRTFRIVLEESKVVDAGSGQTFASHRQPESYPFYADRNKKLSFSPDQALMPQTNYRFTTTAKAQEFSATSRTWNDVYFKNELVRETKESSFKTGECKLEDYITSKKNRIAAYPFPGQRYFLPGESKRGALVLDRNYSCTDTKAKGYTLVAKFTVYKNRQKQTEFERAINASGKYLLFDLPELPNTSLVEVTIIKRAAYNTTRPAGIMAAAYAAAKTKTLDVPLYTYHFQTSRYNTLAEKMKGMRFKSVKGHFLTAPTSEMSAVENFDQFDVAGFQTDTYQNNEMFFTMPLVNPREIKAYNSWSKNHAYPGVYDYYARLVMSVFNVRKQFGLGTSVSQARLLDPSFPPGTGMNNYVPASPLEIGGYDAPLSQGEIRDLLPQQSMHAGQIMQRNLKLLEL